ncbi:transposase [Kocuria kalidii]|uniref:transposase n=1 Tax=Kocuria kalidii TaxID=3376283 RepID=UPI003799C135
MRTARLDPFHGYVNAIRDELPEVISVLDAFHVVKLDGQMVDAVRRRVQQETQGHRGRAGTRSAGSPRSANRGRAPRREAAPPAEHEAGGREPSPRGHPRLTLLSAAAGRLPRQARNWSPARGSVPDLPDSGNRVLSNASDLLRGSEILPPVKNVRLIEADYAF